MRRLILLFVMLIAGCCGDTVPSDVVKFTDRRKDCDHLRGDVRGELDQKGQQKFETNFKKFCGGTDRELASLRRKYIKNRVVIDILKTYPYRIEVH